MIRLLPLLLLACEPSGGAQVAPVDGGLLDSPVLDGEALDGGLLDGEVLDGAALDGAALDGAPDGAGDLDAGGPWLPAATVRYRLTWRRERTSPAPEGGLVVTNDLGHRIHLTRAYLSSYRAQLVPGPQASMGRSLLSLVGLGTAWAGHTGEQDPSVTPVGQVEDLTAQADVTWAEVAYVVETDRYCKAHYLVGRAEAGTPGLPETRGVVGQSLVLEGTVQRPGEAPAPLAFTTALASGRIGLLVPDGATDETAAFTLDPHTQGVEIRIERDLAGLLDGLDFVAMSPEHLENEVVYRLAEAVHIAATAY